MVGSDERSGPFYWRSALATRRQGSIAAPAVVECVQQLGRHEDKEVDMT